MDRKAEIPLREQWQYHGDELAGASNSRQVLGLGLGAYVQYTHISTEIDILSTSAVHQSVQHIDFSLKIQKPKSGAADTAV
jgi:hypothetical protein